MFKRTAKILKFVKRPAAPPMTKEDRDLLAAALLDLAVEVEKGEIAECSVAYVWADGKTAHTCITPRNPRKLFVAIDRSKAKIIEYLEEEGTR